MISSCNLPHRYKRRTTRDILSLSRHPKFIIPSQARHIKEFTCILHLIGFKLRMVERGVKSLLCHQLRVLTLLDHVAVAYDQDMVGILDGG
jgi:hypothetical protein